MAISEMFFYTLNEHIGAIELKAIDMGGSMYIIIIYIIFLLIKMIFVIILYNFY